MRTRTWIALAAGGVAAAATCTAWVVRQRARADVEALTAAPDGAALTAREIAAGLSSPDFKARVQARRQIDRLPEADRIGVLDALSRDPLPEVRLLAVSAMGPLREAPSIRTALARLAGSDPDGDVRGAAGRVLGGAP